MQRPSASLPHILVGSLAFSLFSFEDLDSNVQSTSFLSAIRTYFDIHDLSKNSVLGFFILLTSDAFHFKPPELLANLKLDLLPPLCGFDLLRGNEPSTVRNCLFLREKGKDYASVVNGTMKECN
jgi:hypothetical protein